MINQEKTLELVDRSQRKDKEKTALSYQDQGHNTGDICKSLVILENI